MSLSEQDARKALGSLGLRPEVHKSQIGTLSGEGPGCARRVHHPALGRAAAGRAHQPPGRRGRHRAVPGPGRARQEGGAIVVASHDKAFVQALQVTDVASVSRGGAGEAGSVRVDAGPLPDAFSPSSPPGPSPLAAVATGGANSANVAEAAVEEVLLPRLEKQAAPKAAVDATSAAKAFKAKVATIEAEELMESIEKQETELEEAQQAMHERWTEDDGSTRPSRDWRQSWRPPLWEKLAATIQAATS
ncbi:unnamed protein product [Prorocentrum cordatum]|uniref:Uncharacterized protein n=1 Tax=Prorocentrum cordatum TaxID=2364126 RepID=A0ABN9YFC4_9DINO|nr:unnamed protein product [Polarella glacialis]